MTLAFDDTGARYYETGVSKGILFPIDDSTGVPWNGLVSVSIDPQGGESERYFFDGVKYMDRVLAEDFQATIQAISTPSEFRVCEGDREYAPGVMTSFNKRDKFHMAWRTEIGNDQGESAGYRIHIAYNNLVQPSARAYQTIADTVTMSTRSFVVTATPACAKSSYFWFDSREYDLSALEAQLYSGVLPRCWELGSLVTPAGGGSSPPPTPDYGCLNFIEDYERYVHGQIVSESVTFTEPSYEENINGIINNGLDIIELPAEGAFAANDSAASEVGTHPVLVDDDDASYITSAQGDLGYTIGLPPLVGYVDGCALELHIRMSISGDVNPDDPDNLDADAQVHISTDATGDTTIGGFSDGTDEGMGFALSAVDGTIVDYVVPLSMDAWVDSTIDDVVTALEAGAYLNVVGATNNNPSTTPVVLVYEASVVMLNDTDPDKYLRSPSVDDNTGRSTVIIHDGVPALVASHSTYVDFKVTEAVDSATVAGVVSDVLTYVDSTGGEPGLLRVEVDAGLAKINLYTSTGGTLLASIAADLADWYQARVDFGYTDARFRVYKRDDPTTFLIDETLDVSALDPMIYVDFYAKYIGS